MKTNYRKFFSIYRKLEISSAAPTHSIATTSSEKAASAQQKYTCFVTQRERLSYKEPPCAWTAALPN